MQNGDICPVCEDIMWHEFDSEIDGVDFEVYVCQCCGHMHMVGQNNTVVN
jgi:hypothetical protein